jgi:hypothetical protein
MSPYIISVVFVLALLFVLISLAPFLVNSSDAAAIDRFSPAETNPVTINQ